MLQKNEIVLLLFSISIMLTLSRIVAEVGKKYHLPIVIGEILVGVILGPTVLGMIKPDWFELIFPPAGSVRIALDGITTLSVIMLLFVAGLEVQLPVVLEQGKLAFYTSVSSMIVPFATGFGVAWYFPEIFNLEDNSYHLLFSLFLGTALAISALPVIARTLMDLNIYKTKVGMIIMASAMFNDLAGWLMFSIILSKIENQDGRIKLWMSIVFTLLFGILMLTLIRKVINRVLPWIQTNFSWPGGVLAISFGLCFMSAAFTEYIGLHAILGAFLFGIALGDSVHMHERTREIIHQFVTNIFAPLFFVSIGLRVNFISNFDLTIVLVILVLAYAGKLIGASFGAWFGGMKSREAFAVGAGLNARGAMEIILGTLALSAGVITTPIFVALVVMALVTSLSSGIMMKAFLRP
ncbi:MAG: sodium:proton exchanger [Bacteroidetes bacterium RIFCSPLOWO2_02_FULL_36_8]|nr:MAG: sodium:proton exchanger [Bacteroidetes bacterium RIFCSPLOWO2_02_FULL_36_8]OFY70237.1 MAG: sodium:proton exchanger [Bacteroidetes bacterium RIFCSPLOWO2_12_FULL_37_12]